MELEVGHWREEDTQTLLSHPHNVAVQKGCWEKEQLFKPQREEWGAPALKACVPVTGPLSPLVHPILFHFQGKGNSSFSYSWAAPESWWSKTKILTSKYCLVVAVWSRNSLVSLQAASAALRTEAVITHSLLMFKSGCGNSMLIQLQKESESARAPEHLSPCFPLHACGGAFSKTALRWLS